MFTLYGTQYESREEHLLTMFQSVLSSQFENATEFGSLLRANTPVSRSKMRTSYELSSTTRRPRETHSKIGHKIVVCPRIALEPLGHAY